jgi:hypothetical protein
MCSTNNSLGQEGGQGNITISSGNVTCSSSGPLINITGDDIISDYIESLAVTVVNSQNPSDSLSAPVSGSIDDDATWSGTWGSVAVGLSQGINVITASDNYESSASLSCFVDDDYVWSYQYYGPALDGCGMMLGVAVACDGTTDDVSIYESHDNPTCHTPLFTDGPQGSSSGLTISDGTVSWFDQLATGCPTYTDPCDTVTTKQWHLYDRTSSSIITDGDTETVTFDRTETTLSVTDSEVSTVANFPPD